MTGSFIHFDPAVSLLENRSFENSAEEGESLDFDLKPKLLTLNLWIVFSSKWLHLVFYVLQKAKKLRRILLAMI